MWIEAQRFAVDGNARAKAHAIWQVALMKLDFVGAHRKGLPLKLTVPPPIVVGA